MLTTTNYGLKKPEGNDVVNIDDFNGNADIIDTKLKEINSALPLKAPLDSPGLTGAPTAPTQTPGDNSTKIANTAFVTIAIANKTSVSGNAGTATKLQTPRNIALAGDVTGSANFDGSGNISITTTVADDSHNHIIANVDGLQSALDVIDTHLSEKVNQSNVVNNLLTTASGYVLDARQGKVLSDNITSVSNKLNNINISRPSLAISATTTITASGLTLVTYTVPYACKLFLNGQATFTVTTADRFTLATKLNGVTFGYSFEEKSTGKKCLSTSGAVSAAANDVITLVINSTVDGAGTVYGNDLALVHLDLIILPV